MEVGGGNPRQGAVQARNCLDRLLVESGDSNFGLKMQAVGAHVLLRLGHKVQEINHPGHPDIVSTKDGAEYRFEVEAEVREHRRRMLTPEDLVGLFATKNVGFFALAVSFPRPYWVVVPVADLARREWPAGNATLEALSDEVLSNAWTRSHLDLLATSCRLVRELSFKQLARRAVEGRPL